jgi:hypothetical protein
MPCFIGTGHPQELLEDLQVYQQGIEIARGLFGNHAHRLKGFCFISLAII